MKYVKTVQKEELHKDREWLPEPFPHLNKWPHDPETEEPSHDLSMYSVIDPVVGYNLAGIQIKVGKKFADSSNQEPIFLNSHFVRIT